jgi:hypothetical protein
MMSAAFDSVVKTWDRIRAGHRSLPTVANIPPASCHPENTAGLHDQS